MRARNVQNYAIIATMIYAKEELKVTNIKFVAFQKVLSGATSFQQKLKVHSATQVLLLPFISKPVHQNRKNHAFD